jgi:hypothetical protein
VWPFFILLFQTNTLVYTLSAKGSFAKHSPLRAQNLKDMKKNAKLTRTYSTFRDAKLANRLVQIPINLEPFEIERFVYLISFALLSRKGQYCPILKLMQHYF